MTKEPLTEKRWRFLVQPRWIAGHVGVLAIVGLMIGLGIWQLDRLDQQKQQNSRIEAALAKSPVTVQGADDLQAVGRYEHVKLMGTWDNQHTVLLRYPLYEGQSGYEVLTPLIVGGDEILVDRGWIPMDNGKTLSLPEPGAVNAAVVAEVEGFVQHDSATSKPVGINEGVRPVPTVAKVDLRQIAERTGISLPINKYVQLSGDVGPSDPRPTGLPELTEGSHWSYALQWFSFATIGVIGWAVVLIRASREQESPPVPSAD